MLTVSLSLSPFSLMFFFFPFSAALGFFFWAVESAVSVRWGWRAKVKGYRVCRSGTGCRMVV